MAYKASFRPIEGLVDGVWQALSERPELHRSARPDTGGDRSGDGV
jgi:arginyl-tRNA--protein-N-Asp/Glu arginylyltransferase